MKIYVSYILKSLIFPGIITITILTGIIWLSQWLRFISIVTNSGLGFFAFIKIATLIIPSLLFVILPISTYIVIIYIYHKLTIDRELIVLMNSGLSKFSIAKPVLFVAILMTAFTYFISLYLLPASYREFKDKSSFYRDNYATIMLEEGVFNNRIKNLTIHAEETTRDGKLKSIFVYDNRNQSKPVTIMAKKGHFFKTENSTKLSLDDGNRQEINPEGELNILYFDNFIYDFLITTDSEKQRPRDPQELYINELFYPHGTDKALANKLIAEAHQRITWPLYNIILALIAFIAACPNIYNRKGQNKRIIAFSIIAIIVIIFAVYINNIIAKFPQLYLLIYLYIAIITAVAIYIAFFKNHWHCPLSIKKY